MRGLKIEKQGFIFRTNGSGNNEIFGFFQALVMELCLIRPNVKYLLVWKLSNGSLLKKFRGVIALLLPRRMQLEMAGKWSCRPWSMCVV